MILVKILEFELKVVDIYWIFQTFFDKTRWKEEPTSVFFQEIW